jgi:hypothetical protein
MGFYFGMKVKLNNEYGIVINPKENSAWGKEPGIIRWDTNKEIDEEDWRGLYGSFIDSGGKEISPNHPFQFIDEDGELI